MEPEQLQELLQQQTMPMMYMMEAHRFALLAIAVAQVDFKKDNLLIYLRRSEEEANKALALLNMR